MKRTEYSQLRIVSRFDDLQRVDFTRLNCVRAQERVRQLRRIGLSDQVIADLVGWSVIDVRRAIGERR